MEFCKVTLTFESVDQILWCDHSNESSLPVLSHGTIYLGCSSNFWVCGPNPMMWPFKWKLSACNLTWCYLFVKILENEIWKFGQNLPLATFSSERINVLSGFYLSLGFNGHFVIPNLAEFRDTAPLEVRLPMLRLGFGGCWSLLLLVAWSYKSAFLVKYCVKYLGTRLFKHLKTGMHLCIFLLEARFNQFSTQKAWFECSSVI